MRHAHDVCSIRVRHSLVTVQGSDLYAHKEPLEQALQRASRAGASSEHQSHVIDCQMLIHVIMKHNVTDVNDVTF